MARELNTAVTGDVPAPPVRPPYMLASLILLIGALLVAGGVWLVALGGSPYYLCAGLAMCASGVLLFRRHVEGAWLYALIFAATLVWAAAEVGLDGWGLVPRLAGPTVLAIWMALPVTRRRLTARFARTRDVGPMMVPGLVGGALAVAVLVGLLKTAPVDPAFQNGVTAAPPARLATTGLSGEWEHFGNDRGGMRFSPLTQINLTNIEKLKPAWIVRLGDGPALATATLEATPIKIGDTLYACNGINDVYALDAETGRIRWHAATGVLKGRHCRGVAYFKVPGGVGQCAERILTATGDARLIALDARTGRACPDFGSRGQVNLKAGMSTAPRGYYMVTSAPAVVRGKVVLGGWVSDGQYWGEPSGVIRAFDAVTGKLAWAFDMGRPDRTTAPATGETYTPATPNSWAPMSADEDLGLVYAPTGNATPDYFGAQRRPFDDQYSSSVVAIDAQTGRVRWSFQTTHHDLWDYDVASQPTLVDIAVAGHRRRALIQPTKRGEIFLLDRVTGRPLAPVTEHRAPHRGAVPEERLAPTQPFSDAMPSFRGPILRESAMWGATPLDQLYCRILFRQARYDGPLTPPGTTPWIGYPGYLGGMDWGSASIDADRGMMIVNSNRFANYNRLVPRDTAEARALRPVGHDGKGGNIGGSVAQLGTPYAARIRAFLSPLDMPCQAPPYGMISAVDLASRKLVWTQPLGSAQDSGPLMLRSMLPVRIGTSSVGGPITTRGGLIFIGATQDHYLRAFETATGALKWQARLPAGAHATPMTYISPASGRQFVAIAAGGSRMLKTRRGHYILAFALPRDTAR